MAFTEVTNWPSLQKIAGLHHIVWWLQQEVTQHKAKFKHTLPKISGWMEEQTVANISWSLT